MHLLFKCAPVAAPFGLEFLRGVFRNRHASSISTHPQGVKPCWQPAAEDPYFPTRVEIWKTGRNSATTIAPMTRPSEAIISGSIRLVSPVTAASTSLS